MRQKSRKRKKLADEEDSEEEEDPSTFSVKTRRRRRNDRRKRRLQAGKPTQPPRYWSKKLRKLEAATAAVAAGAGGGEAAGQGAWAPLQLHWSDIRFRSRKFGVYSQSQRVLHREARRLTGGAPMSRVSIGYGNASTGHNSVIKRPSRGPHKAMQRLLRRCYARSVVMIDEYCTSQVCYNCGLRELRKILPHNGTRRYTVLACDGCGTVWNRDANAAANIRLITACLEEGLPRPEALTRPIHGSGGGGAGRQGGGQRAPCTPPACRLHITSRKLQPSLG
eukprot:XP_001702963.1 predicted protein [Chlamydomonas reinhardtii]